MADIVEQYIDKKNNRLQTFMSRLNTAKILLFGAIVFVLVTINRSNNKSYTLIGWAVLLGVILVLYFKKDKTGEILDEPTVKLIAQEILNKKKIEGKEISYDSNVFTLPQCYLKWENDMVSGDSGPVAWDVGFVEMVHGKNYRREGIIHIHPYKGICTGIEWRPLGYSGIESKDRDVVPVGIIPGTIKTTEYGNPKPQ